VRESLNRSTTLLIDEGLSQGKGSESVINYIHHFLKEYGLGEENLCLHCNNCVGQNKNKYVVAYLVWRVMSGKHKKMSGKHKKITLNLMTTGHTKYDPDQSRPQFRSIEKETQEN